MQLVKLPAGAHSSSQVQFFHIDAADFPLPASKALPRAHLYSSEVNDLLAGCRWLELAV